MQFILLSCIYTLLEQDDEEFDLLLRLKGAWEDRITLAKLKEKIVTEDGRVILRIVNEEWKVPPETLNLICFPLLRYRGSQMWICRLFLQCWSSCLRFRNGRFTEQGFRRSHASSPAFRALSFLTCPATQSQKFLKKLVSTDYYCRTTCSLFSDHSNQEKILNTQGTVSPLNTEVLHHSIVFLYDSITGIMAFSPGKLTRLRELLVSYNRLNCIPEELCSCECLERLELAMNRDLDELPQQVIGFLLVTTH